MDNDNRDKVGPARGLAIGLGVSLVLWIIIAGLL